MTHRAVEQSAAGTATSPSQMQGDNHAHTNALIRETSPYLLQHAHNPVNWHAWGEEAFELARRENKPIFLSIGYSTCYWCHVMERESFEDEATAVVLNEHFICIKVDREERPDVDDIYMAATQVMSGGGGWPMSVFLEPRTLKPFHAGTYYPPRPAFGRPSFTQLLTAISQSWLTRRDAIDAQAEQIADAVRVQLAHQARPQRIDAHDVTRAVDTLMSIYDREHGGFGRAPKFPQPVFLELLMGAAWEREDVRSAVLHTIDRMALGGMYDQVGGGFHRYSVDEQWLVPHFEKMLYDNAQLVSVYAQAFQRTKDPFYAEIVRETLEYVEREMTGEGGAFYSAQDAEVDAREGLNYLWTPDEFRAALGDAGMPEDDITLAEHAYGLSAGPNFRDPHHPEDGWKNVLFLGDKPDVLAAELELGVGEFNTTLARIDAVLLVARKQRPSPRTDDKILSGWNGLMIAAFADASRALDEPRYAAAAARAAEFILTRMRAPDRSLLRSWRDGQAKVPAFLEDYALCIRGLIALYRATNERRWLEFASELVLQVDERFAANDSGAYFDTLGGQNDLFVRTQSTHDGAVPSGNSVMLLNLLDLHELTGNDIYLSSAAIVLRGLSAAIAENPVGSALSTLALHRVAERWPQRLPSGDPPASLHVSIRLSAAEIEIAPEAPATLEVTLDIEPDWHIVAHEPGDERLVGLDFDLVNGDGLKLSAEYPAGEALSESVSVYRGSVTVPLRIEQIGEVRGAPAIIITCQPCTETMCLQPIVQRLDVALRFRPGAK